jgi:hypothetical protein
VRDLLALGRVAEGAGPCIVVQMIWTAPFHDGRHTANAIGGVRAPMDWRNDVVDLKSANGGEQAVLASVARAEADGHSHNRVTSSMSCPSRQMLEDRLG